MRRYIDPEEDREIRSIKTRRWREANNQQSWKLDMPMMAERLRSRRLALGWSQTDLAALLDTCQSAVCQWEKGTTDVQVSSLERWAKALGLKVRLSVEDIWEGTNER